MTEIVSNVALSSIALPILAHTFGKTETNLGLLPATLACSCAFMLPSATPPNAIAYTSGLFKVFPDMFVPGLVMNVAGILCITAWSLFVAPAVFGSEYTLPCCR